MNGHLIDLATVIPSAQIDLRYATEDNFMGKAVYTSGVCFLLDRAAHQLKGVSDELLQRDLRLKVWDGFRSMAVQRLLWERLPDERYVSDPNKGGRHTRGTAIDLTLIDLQGNELEMPSAFDEFSEKAHRSFYPGVSKEAKANAQLLERVMEKHGFVGLPTEWWHFDMKGWEKYPFLG